MASRALVAALLLAVLAGPAATAQAQQVIDGLVDQRAPARRLERRQPATMKMFRDYCSQLSKEQLVNGSCVALAEGFTRAVKAAMQAGRNRDADASKVRIALVAAPPEPRMFYPSCTLRPDARFVSQTRPGEQVSWIWHAFAVVDGVVYDPMYRRGVDTLGTYCRNMWSRYLAPGADAATAPWVYCVAPEDLPRVQGRSPSGRPRMLSYQEISLADLARDPQHLSRPR